MPLLYNFDIDTTENVFAGIVPIPAKTSFREREVAGMKGALHITHRKPFQINFIIG